MEFSLNRRNFVKGAAAVGAFLPSFNILHAEEGTIGPKDDQINVALIGFGAEARVLSASLVRIPGVRVRAVCDIWKFQCQQAKQFFKSVIDELYKQAYKECPLLEECCSMSAICPALVFNEQKVIDGLNEELGTSLSTIEDAYDEVDRIRYDRFNKLVDQKFTDDKLKILLDDFDNRDDEEINSMVTDNADIPTIFEYVLGIIWWKASGKKGKILDFLKLSLDSNLLPVTHAAGGEADIVYEYKACSDYPEHSVLLEATLADGTNQRRMEMEPVSRHLGNHLLRTKNRNSYSVFATSYLHINVIGDFRMRKLIMYCDAQDPDNYVDGMKIIPLGTNDLRTIIDEKIPYSKLYKHFSNAYESQEQHPMKWYDDYVCLRNSDLCQPYYPMAAESFDEQ